MIETLMALGCPRCGHEAPSAFGFVWAAAVGLWRLWVTVQRPDVALSSRALIASLPLGWGLFNAVEGALNHQLMGLHHVRPGPAELAWDLAFIGSGLVLCLSGWVMLRSRLTSLRGR